MWSKSSSLNEERRSTPPVSSLRIRLEGVTSVKLSSLHRFGMLQATPKTICASVVHGRREELGVECQRVAYLRTHNITR